MLCLLQDVVAQFQLKFSKRQYLCPRALCHLVGKSYGEVLLLKTCWDAVPNQPIEHRDLSHAWNGQAANVGAATVAFTRATENLIRWSGLFSTAADPRIVRQWLQRSVPTNGTAAIPT
jgi:hypothetical protein